MTMSAERFYGMDGHVVPSAQAVFPIHSPAAKYGLNVFEGLRGYWNEEGGEVFVFRCAEHYRRLLESARMIWIPAPWTADALRTHLIEVARANAPRGDIQLRHGIYLGGDAEFASTTMSNHFVIVNPRGRAFDTSKGIAAGVSSWGRLHDSEQPPRVKAGANYLNSRLALLEARRHGYETAILLGRDGKVAEAPTACLFMVRHGRVVTPPVTASILESITRDTVMTLLRDELGQAVGEVTIDRTELYVADEIFLAGTAAEVIPVTSVDGLKVGTGEPGELTRRVQRIYEEVVRGRVARYAHWLTPVYGTGASAAQGVA
jgi:branched-chain amino acid aminotransferase